MELLCFGKDYEDKFDINWYLALYDKDCYAANEGNAMCVLHRILSDMDPKPGGKMLEFGPGPSIHLTLSASRVFPNITMAEYAAPNREAIVKWLRQTDPGAFDWKPLMSIVAGWEGISVEDIEKRTRAAIKEVIPCDVSQEHILGDHHRGGGYDFLTSSLCLEAACTDLDQYNRTIQELCGLLKPGGSLFVCGMYTKTFYMVSEVKFRCLSVTREQVVEAYAVSGEMTIKSLQAIAVEGWEEYTEGNAGFFMLHAVKEA